MLARVFLTIMMQMHEARRGTSAIIIAAVVAVASTILSVSFVPAPGNGIDEEPPSLIPPESNQTSAGSIPDGFFIDLIELDAGGVIYQLIWNPVIGASSYNVYRSSFEFTTKTGAMLKASQITSRYYNDNVGINVYPGYYYAVTSIAGSTESGLSRVLFFEGEPAGERPVPPDTEYEYFSYPEGELSSSRWLVDLERRPFTGCDIVDGTLWFKDGSDSDSARATYTCNPSDRLPVGSATVIKWKNVNGARSSNAEMLFEDAAGTACVRLRVVGMNVQARVDGIAWMKTGITTVYDQWFEMQVEFTSNSTFSLYVNGLLKYTGNNNYPWAMSMNQFSIFSDEGSISVHLFFDYIVFFAPV